mmetsp:Transcript_13572/g.42677  ORF Transcript_13572/g.42677 Transcript_13572/m.42677 type:complete len:205 (+) Transcript_13572:1065-1679(+)
MYFEVLVNSWTIVYARGNIPAVHAASRTIRCTQRSVSPPASRSGSKCTTPATESVLASHSCRIALAAVSLWSVACNDSSAPSSPHAATLQRSLPSSPATIAAAAAPPDGSTTRRPEPEWRCTSKPRRSSRLCSTCADSSPARTPPIAPSCISGTADPSTKTTGCDTTTVRAASSPALKRYDAASPEGDDCSRCTATPGAADAAA